MFIAEAEAGDVLLQVPLLRLAPHAGQVHPVVSAVLLGAVPVRLEEDADVELFASHSSGGEGGGGG